MFRRGPGVPSIFPFAKQGYPRPNINETVQINTGGITSYPHPFPVHSTAGGEDSSPSAARRLMIDRQGFYHYNEMQQPPPGMARFAFTNHRVEAIAVTGPGPGVPNPPNPYQNGMLYMADPAGTINGLGGLAAGQVEFQNLVNEHDFAAGIGEFQP